MRSRFLLTLVPCLLLAGMNPNLGWAQEAKDKPAAAAPVDAKAIDAVTKLTTQINDLEKVLKTMADDANAKKGEIDTAITDAKVKADTAWMLVSSALVMLMVPGLALFYGGMVRRKNVLATMMQSMACLALVGLYWVASGYS
jgi:hypothetical protein